MRQAATSTKNFIPSAGITPEALMMMTRSSIHKHTRTMRKNLRQIKTYATNSERSDTVDGQNEGKVSLCLTRTSVTFHIAYITTHQGEGENKTRDNTFLPSRQQQQQTHDAAVWGVRRDARRFLQKKTRYDLGVHTIACAINRLSRLCEVLFGALCAFLRSSTVSWQSTVTYFESRRGCRLLEPHRRSVADLTRTQTPAKLRSAFGQVNEDAHTTEDAFPFLSCVGNWLTTNRPVAHKHRSLAFASRVRVEFHLSQSSSWSLSPTLGARRVLDPAFCFRSKETSQTTLTTSIPFQLRFFLPSRSWIVAREHCWRFNFGPIADVVIRARHVTLVNFAVVVVNDDLARSSFVTCWIASDGITSGIPIAFFRACWSTSWRRSKRGTRNVRVGYEESKIGIDALRTGWNDNVQTVTWTHLLRSVERNRRRCSRDITLAGALAPKFEVVVVFLKLTARTIDGDNVNECDRCFSRQPPRGRVSLFTTGYPSPEPSDIRSRRGTKSVEGDGRRRRQRCSGVGSERVARVQSRWRIRLSRYERGHTR